MIRRLWGALAVAVAVQIAIHSQQPAPFKAETRLVVLHVTVRNSRGEVVTNLNQGAFTVYENGRRQPITLFRRDDIPVSLGLLIDNSGSMRHGYARGSRRPHSRSRGRRTHTTRRSCSTSTTKFTSTCRSRATWACSKRALREWTPSAARRCATRSIWRRRMSASTARATARCCS